MRCLPAVVALSVLTSTSTAEDAREPVGIVSHIKVLSDHCEDVSSPEDWHEDGQQKTHVHVANRPQETYVIDCGPKTVVHSFTVELTDYQDGQPAPGLVYAPKRDK